MDGHDGGHCLYRSVHPIGLTTAMGSVLVGDATSDIRGFRILGASPPNIFHLAPLLRQNDCRMGGVKYVT